MLFTCKLNGAESEALADIITQFYEEELGVHVDIVRDKTSVTRNATTDTIVISATILQGVASGIYIANYVDARRRVADIVSRIKVLLQFGGSATLQRDAQVPLDLANATPEDILSELNINKDTNVDGDHR